MVTASAPYMTIAFATRRAPCWFVLAAGREKRARARIPNTGAVRRRLRLLSLNILTRISFRRQYISPGVLQLPRRPSDDHHGPTTSDKRLGEGYVFGVPLVSTLY